MKSDSVFILHIVDSIDQIMEYTDGLSGDEFKNNRLVQDAVIRNFEIIGEASKQISTDTRTNHPDIPWGSMAGMRDKLIHNYLGVDLNIVWNTITEVLPNLRSDLIGIADD